MVIYADILIVLNIIVNYFLLLAAAELLRRKVNIMRILSGSLIGGIASLYIFLPQVSVLSELLFKLLLCFSMTVVVFGIRSAKQYFKAAGIFFIVTCGYAGVMIAVWHIFKPNGMAINNSVVYFNISPIILVISSVAAYLLLSLSIKIFSRSAIYAEECNIEIEVGNNKTEIKAIVDTGNSVSDIFGKSEIIIADQSVVKKLFGENCTDYDNRYRAVPFNSVSGYGMLDGYRCDSGILTSGKKTVLLDKPIIAASKTPINDGFDAIVNPKILD